MDVGNHKYKADGASKHLTARVSADDHRRLELVASEDERSVSSVIRLAIRRYLDDRLGRAA